MNHKVHHIVGLVAVQGTLLHFDQPVMSNETVIAIMGGYYLSMAPDLDDDDSFLARHQPFRMVAKILGKLSFIKHRGFTHSLLALILLYLFFTKIIPVSDVVLYSFMIAFASHLLLDMFNSDGILLLYPFKFRMKLLPSMFAIKSDKSFAQDFIYVIFSGIFYFVAFHYLVHILQPIPWFGSYLYDFWFNIVIPYLPKIMREFIL
ncbi:metal-dependent hydrolase [Longirhabdus pacifica]|uniref:metal-dependent hydrolase n=1 Tax=Longirhabdus pacifica TaxID=2305227 RepID=UPI001009034D|nr:metal-dependent hydrolase [Longirhabdus pacifica]